jgi:NDP-sugar pyrophosphorylase family protein
MPTPSPKVRITISLAKETADQVDLLVDGMKVRNRSHAIEGILNESLQLSRVKQAVILAGGEHAQRRIPAIISTIKLLRSEGIFSVTIALGYLGDSIKSELRKGEKYGVSIEYVQSELGTAGALTELKNRFKSTFLVVNLEKPALCDLKNLLKFHREHQPIATIATKSLQDLKGIYAFEPSIFKFIPSGFSMLEETVFHELTKQGKLLPYPILSEP